MNSKVYYKLTERIVELEEQIKPFNDKITELQETAKKLKKDSVERKSMQEEVQLIKDSMEYQVLKAKIEAMYYCRTIYCYTYNEVS